VYRKQLAGYGIQVAMVANRAGQLQQIEYSMAIGIGNDDSEDPQITEVNHTTASSILHAAYIYQLLHCSSMAG